MIFETLQILLDSDFLSIFSFIFIKIRIFGLREKFRSLFLIPFLLVPFSFLVMVLNFVVDESY